MESHVSKGLISPNKNDSKVKQHEVFFWFIFHKMFEPDDEAYLPELRMKDDLFFP